MDQSLGNKTITNYYDYVFKNSIKSDITLVVKDKLIKAHKLVLGPQNPVFMETFISQPRLTKIEITDLDPTAFQIFVDFLYTGNVSDANINEDVLLVAHRFSNPTLLNICRDKLRKTINSGDVIHKLLIFIQCDQILAKEMSIFVAKNFNNFKTRPNFKLVLENQKAMTAIVDVFGDCQITVLTNETNPTKKDLIESAKSSDLTIKVQDDYFLAHKDFLSSQNKVLKTVISALPTTSNFSSSINVLDLDPKVFKNFLKYIYTGEVDEKEISKELLQVAHKYTDRKLKKICEEHLLTAICEGNAAELLILATIVGCQKLIEKTSKFIAERYVMMKEQDVFQKVKEHPAAIEAIFIQFADTIDTLYTSKTNQKDPDYFKYMVSLKAPVTKDLVTSELFYLGKIPWRVCAKLKETGETYVGLYLRCADKNVPYEHKANFTMKLISSFGETHDHCPASLTKKFASKESRDGWGRFNFIRLSDLLDEKNGFVTNGIIRVEVQLKFVD